MFYIWGSHNYLVYSLFIYFVRKPVSIRFRVENFLKSWYFIFCSAHQIKCLILVIRRLFVVLGRCQISGCFPSDISIKPNDLTETGKKKTKWYDSLSWYASLTWYTSLTWYASLDKSHTPLPKLFFPKPTSFSLHFILNFAIIYFIVFNIINDSISPPIYPTLSNFMTTITINFMTTILHPLIIQILPPISSHSRSCHITTRFGSRGFGRPTFRQTCTSVVNHEDMESLFPFLTKWEAHIIQLNFFLV